MKSRFALYGFWISLLLLTLGLVACAPSLPSPDVLSQPPATSTVLPNLKLAATLSTPHIDQPPDGIIATTAPIDSTSCGYQWAQQDLPELTAQLQAAIQGFQPTAQVKAFAFGEDCVHVDGSSNFLAMETDFNISMQVDDSGNEEKLGTLIVQVMQVILNIPKDQIKGPRPGRVSFLFQGLSQNQGVSFYIDQYQALPAGLSNTEIYPRLKSPQ